MPVALIIKHVMGMSHLSSVASPAQPYFTHCLINDTIVGKKLLNVRYMFGFIYYSGIKVSYSKKNWVRND